ncbi:MAG: Hsp70 family protein [Pseudomonadota bacterium]
MTHCGLDFGTSNSVIAHANRGDVRLLELEPGERVLPSALFFDEELAETVIGTEAIERYLSGVEGRLMRALKSVLGSDLMSGKTQVLGHNVSFTNILTGFLRQMKKRAEDIVRKEITQIVLGRPVHFHNRNHDADTRAAETLEAVAKAAGYRDVTFMFEPLAAAAAFEATLSQETLVMVADIGGGTSDFSISRLSPERRDMADRSDDVLAATGVRLGGTDLDRRLSLAEVMPHLGLGVRLKDPRLTSPNWIYQKLATWSEINQLYAPGLRQDWQWLKANAGGDARIDRLLKVIDGRHGHRLAAQVEAAKIALSSEDTAEVSADYAGIKMPIKISRQERDDAYLEDMDRLTTTAAECIRTAGLTPENLDAIMFTGGTSYMALVREAIGKAAPDAKALAFDRMGAVASGLALTAERLYCG